MQSWLPELCCKLCLRSELQTVRELQSICWTWLHLNEKWDQMTQEITIKLTLGLKMIIFIVFMVIENIPDLKIWLLSGIWLSSGDLLSIEFSLFFRLFLRFFLCFCYKKVFSFHFLVTSRFFGQFWCHFSRSDCHTPSNYLRSHLGLGSTKILLWKANDEISGLE